MSEEAKPVRLLDETRPYCFAGIGNRRFYGQDGKHFDMNTLEEVDISTLSSNKSKSVLTCTFCGAKRDTPEIMREHLLALHKDDMEKDKAKKDEPEKPQVTEIVTPESISKQKK